jgi:hypothetical protein
VGSWQIDRGIFENFLGEEVQRRGMRFEDGATMRGSPGQRRCLHTVSWQRNGQEPQTVQARWVIDACGRAGLLKRKLNLAKGNDHPVHSVWFRIQDRIADDWTDDTAWRDRCPHAHALAVHQPPGGRGLLGVADPAVFGLAFGGHRGRPGWHPLEAWTPSTRRWTGCKVHQPRLYDDLDRQARQAAGLRLLQALLVRLRTGALTDSAGRWPAKRGAFWTRSIRRAATSSPSPTPTSPNWWRVTCRASASRPT